jgi:hypothetical protein
MDERQLVERIRGPIGQELAAPGALGDLVGEGLRIEAERLRELLGETHRAQGARHLRRTLVAILLAVSVNAVARAADRPGVAGGEPTSFLSARGPEARPLAPEPNPYTMAPGRLAIEVDLINYTRDRTGGISTTALEWPVLLRFGIIDNLEFQAKVEAFVWERSRENNQTQTNYGFGTVVLRPKLNFWGNDRHSTHGQPGRTAMAVMPFIRLPTETNGLENNNIEGGVLFPWDMDITERLTLEITPELGIVRADRDRRTGYHADFGTLVSLNYRATDEFTPFVEFFGARSAEAGSSPVGIVLAGVTFELDGHTVIEPVSGLGLTREADDFHFAITVVRRF